MVPVILGLIGAVAGYKGYKNHKATGHWLGTHAPISPTHYTGAPGDYIMSVKARFGFPLTGATETAFKAVNPKMTANDLAQAKGLINLPPGAVDKGPRLHATGKAS